MEGAMFQPHLVTVLSSLVYVALDLESRIEGTSEASLDGCSSRNTGDGEEISITEVKYPW